MRWNAMAMVVNAERNGSGVGGHIASYASAATLYEVAYNHFLRGGDDGGPADLIFSRATPRPATTRAPSSKAGSRCSNCKISAANSPTAAASPVIRIRI